MALACSWPTQEVRCQWVEQQMEWCGMSCRHDTSAPPGRWMVTRNVPPHCTCNRRTRSDCGNQFTLQACAKVLML
jgi:hypothetical protein